MVLLVLATGDTVGFFQATFVTKMITRVKTTLADYTEKANVTRYLGKEWSMSVIEEKLKHAIELGPIPQKDRRYIINGWRWHTKSVLR